MSTGEAAYLLMVIVVTLAFMGMLAWVSRRTDGAPPSERPPRGREAGAAPASPSRDRPSATAH